MRCEGLNVYDILKYEKLVLLEGAIKGIEGRLLS
jgi:large subunit ribosomal protein L4